MKNVKERSAKIYDKKAEMCIRDRYNRWQKYNSYFVHYFHDPRTFLLLLVLLLYHRKVGKRVFEKSFMKF